LKRKFRLTRSTDIKRVRRYGKSYAHPLVVLIKHPNELFEPRFAVTTSRYVGNAVRRNHVKRQIREVIRSFLPLTSPGWDIIILARQPIRNAPFFKIQSAVQQLMQQAGLLEDLDVN